MLNSGAYRQVHSVVGDTGPTIIPIPEGVEDLTIYVKASAAAGVDLTETPDDADAVEAATAEWMAVDATLTGVGTTYVRFRLAHTPNFLRAVADAGQTATVVLCGKRTV